MIQLKVYKQGTPYINGIIDEAGSLYLDLYDSEPIKLTLSIEDITNADASSVFSKTFRVPATRDNNEFFSNAYAIDGIDFDVTQKNTASVLVDGAEFRAGHIRLQKIFRNQDQDRIDYELLFLGETRDFSSIIAEKTLCQLTMTDFDWEGLPNVYTNAADFTGPFQYNDIVSSWNAFPQNASLTGGYADGDIIMPLIDHGNTYTDGDPDQGTVSLGSAGQGIRSFTHSGNSLSQTRMKPMFRAKRVLDQIFEDAGYTYSSDFLNSDRFHQMYISAFGNNEQIGMEIDQVTGTNFESNNPTNGENDVEAFMYNDNVITNIAGNYTVGASNVSSNGNGSYFTCPADAALGGNFYIMSASAEMLAEIEQSNGPNVSIGAFVRLVVVNTPGGTITQTLATGNYAGNGSTSSLTWDSRNGGYQPIAGDIIQVYLEPDSNFVDYSWADNTYWDCTAAPGDYYSPLDLDCEHKQIDYIKDLLTMFRLVMQPDNSRPNNFIIEPWQEFIGSGITYDWSDKLAEQNDQVLEPLFNTQSATIEYSFAQDEDFINKFHFDNNKHPYGYLQFNSANELLKGERKVDVKGLAPTPIDQITHGSSGAHPEPKFILPSIVEVTGDSTTSNPPVAERLPIKPKTRFLFYNGKIPITVSQNEWYLNNDSGSSVLQTNYPLVSPYENWPIQQTSLNLNFSNDTRYYISPSPGTGYFDQGSTLFDEYWSRYIASLYNKFSRRLTAKFILNNVDLQYLTFDDVIFVNGKYYRPEKIIDAQVGAETEVTVQLITLNDQRPIWLDEPLTGFSVAVSNTSCAGEQGEIQVTTNGTPAFTWELTQSGAQGNANPSGNAPFTFVISAPVGIDTLIVTDSLGRTATIQVDVPVSTAIPVSSTNAHTDPNVCSPGSSSLMLNVNSNTSLQLGVGPDGNASGYIYAENTVLDTYSAWSYYGSDEIWGLNPNTVIPATDHIVTEGNFVFEINTGANQTEWDLFRAQTLEVNFNGVNTNLVDFITTLPATVPAVGTQITVSFGPTDFGPIGASFVNWGIIIRPATPGGSLNLYTWLTQETSLIKASVSDDCNGIITVTPTGGAGAPYTITWDDDPNETSFSRTDLCPGTYQYYIEDVDGCQSDIFTETLTCVTQLYTYQLREHLNNCSQSSSATYIATSTSQLPINQTCTLNELQGCFYVQSTSTETALYTIDALNTDCASCNGGQTANSYMAENCNVQGDFIYVSLTQAQLTPNDVIKAQGVCYEVIQQSTVIASTAYQDIFTDCQTCDLANGGNYLVQDCAGFSGGVGSSTVSLNVGDVIKVGTNCAEVLSVSQGTATFVIDASTIYTDCNDCAGTPPPPVQNCHEVENTGLGTAAGTYTFNGLTYNWSAISGSTLSLCAEVGSVAVTSGTGVNVTNTGNACISPKACRIPPPFCQSYLISNDGGSNPGSYSYINCDGFTVGGLLNLGSSTTVCAIQIPTVSSGLTISFGITSCD